MALRQAASEDHVFTRDFPNVDVGAVLNSWVQAPGSPVVNVNVNTATGVISLTQVCASKYKNLHSDIYTY